MNLVKEFLLLKAKVDKLYCQLIAKSPDEQDPTVPNHVKNIKQEDINNWNKVKDIEDVKVQITEDTLFAQIGQTQKDFNKNVSDYKINFDLKNQEQDDRLTDIEDENAAQNDLINDLQNSFNLKQDKLSSYDESILIETDGNIEGNVSLFEEYFEQQECELNFTPIQIVAVYQDGIKLLNSEYEIILPKKIKMTVKKRQLF
jgi:hypothetical protein